MEAEILIVRAKKPRKKIARAVVATKTTRVRTKPAPKAAPAPAKIGGVTPAAVLKATGRSWQEWLTLLDKAGAAKMTHKEIAALAHDRFGASPWWAQMVTVGYEQARGLREKHQKPGGFSISGSKTVNLPVAMLYEAWADAKLRKRWLGAADLLVRKATPGKSMRITWDATAATPTNLDVNFFPKGEGKSLVSIEHSKLKTAAAGQKLKAFWAERLGVLKELLEK